MSHIHENRIQRRHHFLDSTVVYISHREIVLVTFLTRHFLQSVILCQRYRDLLRLDVHNQFAFHT